MNKLYLIWHSYLSGTNMLIGQLIKGENGYVFTYNIQEAVKAQNEGCTLPFDLNSQVHTSDRLFPFFQNRVMNPQRESLNEYLRTLNMGQYDEFQILAKTKGINNNDNYLLISEAEVKTILDGGSARTKR